MTIARKARHRGERALHYKMRYRDLIFLTKLQLVRLTSVGASRRKQALQLQFPRQTGQASAMSSCVILIYLDINKH